MTESTLCLKYFRNIVNVMTKGKNKKRKTTKIYLFLLPPLPFQDGGVVATAQLFPRQKFLKTVFIDTWVSGQRVSKLIVWQSWQKRKNATRENLKGGGCNNPPPPPSWERGLSNTYQMWLLLLKFIGEQDSGKILRQGDHM